MNQWRYNMWSDQLFAQGFATQRSIAVEMAQLQNQIAELLGDKSYAFIFNERFNNKVDVITIDSIPEDGLKQGEILVGGKGLNHTPDIIHTLSNSSQGNLELKVSKNRKTQNLHVSLEHDKAWCDAFEVQSEASKEFDEKLVLENFDNVVSKLDLGNKGDK